VIAVSRARRAAGWLSSCLIVLAVSHAAMAQLPEAGPLEPAEALNRFRLPDDLAIEIVACEPDLADPVSVCWDEAGRMIVVEMGDYPAGPPGGRIRRFLDRDGDGRADHGQVFADGLPHPTSALPFNSGLLVAAAPDVLFLKDTDGDGRADLRKTLFTGFGEGNPQLRVNSLTWGLDGWVYGANGRSDGDVRPATDESRPAVSIRGRDFRFRPDDGSFEATTGFSQFGLAFDDAGRRLLSWNTVHVRQVILERRYVERNSRGPLAVEEISDHGSACRVYPASATTPRFNAEPPGFMNASCGLTVYRGGVLPAAYRHCSYVCEPLSNLVHRDVLSAGGAALIARRGEQDREFLSSTDPWFRPVNLATGPDGGLYVVDFYRALVEHPRFVADAAARDRTDFRRGDDRGRIYRIVPKGFAARGWPDLTTASPHQLVGLLSHSNAWWRETAARLLVERDGASVVPALETAAQNAPPAGRLQGLWLLSRLGALSREVLVKGLADEDPAVRRTAIVLSETLGLEHSPDLLAGVMALADDPDPEVRFQLLCTLGSVDDSRAALALGSIARRDRADSWIRRGLLTCRPDVAARLVHAVLDHDSSTTETPFDLETTADLASLVGEESPSPVIEGTFDRLARQDQVTSRDVAVMAGLLEGLVRAGHPRTGLPSSNASQLSSLLSRIEDQAGLWVAQPEVGDPLRTLCIRFLAGLPPETLASTLGPLVDPAESPAVLLLAIRTLARHGSAPGAQWILDAWDRLTPSARRAALDGLLDSPQTAMVVHQALLDQSLLPTDVDPVQAERILAGARSDDRPALAQMFERTHSAEREAALRAGLKKIESGGDSARGAELFQRHCIACHSLAGVGQRVGPDLASVAGRPPEDLLRDVLDPNRSVVPDAVEFVIVTRGGRVVTGLFAGESPRSMTVRRADGVEEVVPRDQVEELRSTGRSLMPEGFEKSLSADDLADLVAFLRRGEAPR
jgi:putative membrane-bound dehydrogenase-like protein